MHRTELSIYFVVFVSSLLYSLFRFYQTSKEYLHQLDGEDFQENCWINWLCDMPQDVTDLEWQVVKQFYLQSKVIYLAAHLVGFYLIRQIYPKLLCWFVIVFTSCVIGHLISTQIVFLIYCNIFFIFALEHLFNHYHFKYKQFIHYILFMVTIIFIHKNDTHHDHVINLLIQVGFSWLNAKCLSCSIDIYNQRLPLSIIESKIISLKIRLAYLLYFPPFFFGPIYHYSDFANLIHALEEKQYHHKINLKQIFRLFRYIWWAWFLELIIHFIYSSSLQYYMFLIENFDAWSLCGFAFALTIVFYLKYLIIYGISMSIAEIDGLIDVIAQPPECIAHMHQTSYLWRKFDQGLYSFLVKYFYKPLTGTDHTNPLRKIFAGFVCFTIVAIWHGYYDSVIVWVTINVILSYSEILGSLLKNGYLFNILTRKLPQDYQLRLEAIIGAPYLMMAYLSNVFFLSNYENGVLVWKRIFTQFPIPLLPTILIFYCGCHVCRYINMKIKSNQK